MQNKSLQKCGSQVTKISKRLQMTPNHVHNFHLITQFENKNAVKIYSKKLKTLKTNANVSQQNCQTTASPGIFTNFPAKI